MKIRTPEKQILINNFMHVEEYLDLSIHDDIKLEKISLADNLEVPGVEELLSLIPDGYNPQLMKEFYETTGLKLLVEVNKGNCEVVLFDKDGRYPREDAAVWNKDFMAGVSEHHEWLEPQEEPDILIRYIF